MIKRIGLSSKDVLCFPRNMSHVMFEGKHVVISPLTANWVVFSHAEYEFFCSIKECKSIDEIIIKESNMISPVMKKLLARKFIGINNYPSLEMDSGRSAYFCLTNECNLCCKHCYVSGGDKYSHCDELSVKQWINIASVFSQIEGRHVTLTGGEILLKRGWKELISTFHNMGLKITILTNGTLWTEQDIVDASKYVDEVQISLDGTNEGMNSHTRGRGNFKKSLTAAKVFDKLNVRTSLAMTPLNDCIDDFFRSFSKFYYENICGSNIIIRLTKKLLPFRNGERVPHDEQVKYRNKMCDLSNVIYPSAMNSAFYVSHPPNHGIKNCGFGGLTIDPYGFVYPCNRIKEVSSQHNCLSDSLEDVVTKLEEYADLFSVDNLQQCRICDLRYICGGGCRLDNCAVLHKGKVVPFSFDYINNVEVIRKAECCSDDKNALIQKMVNMMDFLHV